ncbi:MAG: D-alanine--D-alanine ligase [Bacillota bacterium]
MKLGILVGGRSGEHEVSVMSAKSVFEAVDKNKYDPLLIGISKEGCWYLIEDPESVFSRGFVGPDAGLPVTIIPQPQGQPFVALDGSNVPGLDVVFPVLHGTFGEDGTVQGLLDLAGIPYVGAGVMASAVGMDKIIMKRLFRHAGLPVVNDISLTRRFFRESREEAIKFIEEHIPYPCFVKPANLGSSVGVSKADSREELDRALDEAARYDFKIIVEQGVPAREIECSVLGNDAPECSIPGEIIPGRDFYDYEAKYKDDRSQLLIPAPLTEEQVRQVKDLAVRAFRAIDCAGLARVDFFVTKDTGKIFVNEINTMPGFTTISMYPKLWEASGLPYDRLISRLIELALEKHKEKSENETTYS